ncbi:hypothetical protein E1B28_012701 [Marasmius oreades]|uniref:Uncharacterized protein n=1 Tax=Marasmius oreades TaxID=181124 RepID=A0A9P7RSR8_9AGAR|nr:uncharacterized protein E1B28_012701 [Marasmius oreades]KAG7088733.1 hypothetical protein E1B28_012701 [Marasmius oreades]
MRREDNQDWTSKFSWFLPSRARPDAIPRKEWARKVEEEQEKVRSFNLELEEEMKQWRKARNAHEDAEDERVEAVEAKLKLWEESEAERRRQLEAWWTEEQRKKGRGRGEEKGERKREGRECRPEWIRRER